jgi:asparagine synthase (glutamine-hydrolysing)
MAGALIAGVEISRQSRLMSEVPLGAFLSGGLDSSAIVALMSEIVSQPVKTATIGFHEEPFDESPFARQVSEYLHTDHHERFVTPNTIETIKKLVWHFDEPFADPSALPTYYVSQVAREKVTVALSGDGGDENFGGYHRYLTDLRENRNRSILPLPVRRMVFGPLAAVYPRWYGAPRFLRAKSTLRRMAFDSVEGYFESMSTFGQCEKSSILSQDLRRRLADYDTIDLFRKYFNQADTDDLLSRIQYVDIRTYLTDDILAKVDRCSMANSLEVRCPLLDHRIVELAASMPSDMKVRNGAGKYIFKQALRGHLPDEIIFRKKMGFGIPLPQWFRSGIRDFARTYILEREDPFLSSAFVKKVWTDHQSGLRDCSYQLWNILMFRVWYERNGAGN